MIPREVCDKKRLKSRNKRRSQDEQPIHQVRARTRPKGIWEKMEKRTGLRRIRLEWMHCVMVVALKDEGEERNGAPEVEEGGVCGYSISDHDVIGTERSRYEGGIGMETS